MERGSGKGTGETEWQSTQLKLHTMIIAVKEREKQMTKLDDAISNTAYILDSLIALRNIYKTGCCNDCGIKNKCKHAPKVGQMVRYNCPFYVDEGEDNG